MRYCEMSLTESSIQTLDLSSTGTSYETEGIAGGEINRSQKIQSNISTSSAKCWSSDLSSSKNSRDQVKKHECDVCRKEYSRMSCLNRHMLIHNAENPFVCKTCQRPFSRSSHLEDHMLIHTGERPHVCEICQQRFTQSSSLKFHKVIHSGIKLHCDYCYCETPHKRWLDGHLKKYHSEHVPFAVIISTLRYR